MKNSTTIKIIKGVMLICVILLTSCTKFLEAKPDKSLVTPNTMDDLQALLNNVNALNMFQFPALSEVASDDYWVSYDNLVTKPDFFQKHYVWNDAGSILPKDDWFYGPVFIANTVLEEWPKIAEETGYTEQAMDIKGNALFRRAFSFHLLAQTYCRPYSQTGDNLSFGIPYRLSSNFNVPTTRGTVQETYDQIIRDYKLASALLSTKLVHKTRPTKVAALAGLARTFLAMEDYENSGLYADSALRLENTLMDYNTMNSASPNPFTAFNPETIFFAWSYVTDLLNPNIANVDTLLYDSYSNDDIRKNIFFQDNGNGRHGFKGSYAGELAGTFFTGLTTDELYLTRAECRARAGDIDGAMEDLNQLLIKRWKVGKFHPLTASTPDEALILVLHERRKELIMRGIRWSDLRRLNKDPRFAKTLKRVLRNNQQAMDFTLPPNDLRYVLLIPAEVIKLSGIPQNPR